MIPGFANIVGLFSKDLGIDLGTANTLVCVQGQGIVFSEPSVVAVKKGTSEILMTQEGPAVGDRAKEMLGRTPGDYVVVRPMKNGVIADFEITEMMLRYFIERVHGRTWMSRPRVVVSVPSGITAVERRAVRHAAERAGARLVKLIPEPLAAAIGAGLPVIEPTASMIVDVGGGTTEVAVISLAGIVTSNSLRAAGDRMDEAIIAHLRRTYNLLVGEATAERVKIQIGSAAPLEEEMSMEVKGMDQVAGLPRKITVSSEEIREAIREPIEQIVGSVRETLESTPPELAADLVDRGMTLCGGGSLIRGMDKVLEEAIGLPVKRAEDPMTCVARGTVIYLDGMTRQWKRFFANDADL